MISCMCTMTAGQCLTFTPLGVVLVAIIRLNTCQISANSKLLFHERSKQCQASVTAEGCNLNGKGSGCSVVRACFQIQRSGDSRGV